MGAYQKLCTAMAVDLGHTHILDFMFLQRRLTFF
jgi:hypothetical protein